MHLNIHPEFIEKTFLTFEKIFAWTFSRSYIFANLAKIAKICGEYFVSLRYVVSRSHCFIYHHVAAMFHSNVSVMVVVTCLPLWMLLWYFLCIYCHHAITVCFISLFFVTERNYLKNILSKQCMFILVENLLRSFVLSTI